MKLLMSSVPSWIYRPLSVLITIATVAILISSINLTPGHAQVTTTITSSGLNTVVTPNGNVQDITGGTRAGSNLFHSFGQFNVGVGDIANFQNTPVTGAFPATSNILGLINGGQPSQIFGTLRTTDFGNANLFLINPSGLLFGPTASLDIGATSVSGAPHGSGSFYASTADYIRLGSGATSGYFYADAARESILTSAPVTAFGFLGSSPGAITVQGSQLSVASGQTIGLVGGNIDIQAGTITDGTTVTTQAARLLAPNGQIQLASATSPGEFVLSNLKQPVANVDGASFTSFGLITLGSDSTINVSGTNNVSIRGGEFVLSVNDAVLSTAVTPATAETVALGNGSAILASTQGSSSSGDIDIAAKTIQLNGSTIRTASLDPATGDAGNITVAASDTLLLSASGITSLTTGGGASGTINVTGRPSVSLEDGSVLQTQTIGSNRAGDINLTVANLTMTGGSDISTSAGTDGLSGSIAIDATDTISLSSSGIVNSNNGFGGTGGIAIKAKTLELSNTSFIKSDTYFGLEGAETPKISIVADDKVTVSSDSGIVANATLTDVGAVQISSQLITVSERGFIATTTGGSGNAGALTLNTHDLQISSGGQINTKTEQDSGLGGAIMVTATGKVSVSGTESGIFSGSSSPVSTAQGGNILVSAQHIEVTNGGTISANTTLAGNAGNITLKAGSVSIASGGQVTSSSVPRAPQFEGEEPPLPTGNAGTVTIQGLASPAQSVLIDGTGSGIFTDTQGTGAGGNIFMNANSVTLQNGGTLSAKTSGTEATATGGSIAVNTTDHVTMTGDASITASSTGPGNAGNISINAGQQFEMRNSSVKTESAQASGGNIDIQAVDRVRLVNSSISTSVLGGGGSGGNITIDPNVVVLQNSQVIAQAVQGAGGNITIFTPLYLKDSSSVVSASSQFGLNGTVTIQSPTSNLSGSLGTLPSNSSEAQSLLTQRCAALANGQASSFVVAGREHLPADPGGWLSGPIALAGIDAERFGDGTVAEGTSNLEPQTSGLLANDTVSLRRLTPAGFLIANFADSEATGCHS